METHFEPRISCVLKSCENVGISFVFTELTVGITSCKIARTRRHLGMEWSSAVQQAEKALLSATQSMQKFKGKFPEYDQMTALAERIRMELDELRS